MKICPFCKAEIEDNARFCLYCMRSLEEKQVVAATKKRPLWPVLATGLSVLALLVWLLLPEPENMPVTPTEPPVLAETTLPDTTGQPTTQETEGTTAPEQTTPVTTLPSNTKPEVKPTPETTLPEVTTPETTVPEQITPVTTLPPNTRPEVKPIPETTIATTTQPEVVSSPVNPDNAVVYSYRPAERTDDLNANYTNPGDHIVITGVVTPSANGEYIIPAYIDGLRVITVDKFAFQGVYVRKILIEDGVKNVFPYAFSDCVDLTDIYIAGISVMISTDAFPEPDSRSGILTFHCSADCHDRTYNFYQTGAAYWFGGQYEEWNG